MYLLGRNALVVDDHKIFAASFSAFLEKAGIFSTVNVAYDMDECRRQLNEVSYEMIFVDYLIPGINMLEELKKLDLKKNDIRAVAVSSVYNSTVISSLLHVGCKGYLGKNAAPEEIEQCVRLVKAGKTYVSIAQRDDLINTHFGGGGKPIFTSRELELLPHIVAGKTIQETAKLLNISPHTVVNHRRHMMEKAEVRSVGALIHFVMEMGLV
jgi:DNA-binding NarL/FixJ family response regulator